MKFKIIFPLMALAASSSMTWASKDKLPALIPGSKVVTEDGNEFEVMTAKNTAIEVEFNDIIVRRRCDRRLQRRITLLRPIAHRLQNKVLRKDIGRRSGLRRRA